MWLSLLLNKYVIGGILLLSIVGGGYFYVTHLQKEVVSLTTKNTALETDLKVSQDSVKSLQGAIADQNTAIDNMKAAADAREKTHAAELAAAKTASNNRKTQATVIMNAKIPQNTSACNAANDLINKEIQNAK